MGDRMSNITSWPSPAKLNLFLYITGRRDNGYHDLQTLFQFLDYGDTLDIEITEDGQITIEPEIEGVPLKSNLIYKAAKALQVRAQIKQGAKVGLHKILPMGGGLGGGSSNAATILVALNFLWKAGLSEDELAHIGLKLGADVPVFVRGFAAFAEGVGEKLQPVEVEEKWYLVVKPNIHIATQNIFTHPDLTRNTPKRPINALLELAHENDCEKIVRSLHSEVDMLLSWLVEYAPSRLTGTGACVFAEFKTREEAEKVYDSLLNNKELKIKTPDLTGFVAKGLNQSPLIEVLLNNESKNF